MTLQTRSIHTSSFDTVRTKSRFNDEGYDCATIPRFSGNTRDGVNHAQAIFSGEVGHQISYFIGTLHDPRVELIKDIPISVETFEGIRTAWSPDLEEWGSGDTETEAVNELRASIVEAYFLYKDEGESHLGPVPLRHWRYLKSIIREV